MTYYDNEPPDVVAPTVAVGVTGTGTIWFPVPKLRTETRYGSALWTDGGLVDFDGDAVNDGDYTHTAFSDTPGASTLTLDAGVGETFEFGEVLIVFRTRGDNPQIESSPDGAAWTVRATAPLTEFVQDDLTYAVFAWADVAKREWRLNFVGGVANEITEVWFRGYGDDYESVGSYRFFDKWTGPRQFKFAVNAEDRPTSALPLNISSLLHSTGNAQSALFDVVVVSRAGIESPGVTVTKSSTSFELGFYSAHPWYLDLALLVPNGLNSNVDITNGTRSDTFTCMVPIEGATGDFLIGGLKPAFNTKTVILYNHNAYVMTLVHGDGSSTGKYQIMTRTGADVAVPAFGWAMVIYLLHREAWLHIA